MSEKYQIERISKQIEQIALFVSCAYEQGLIVAETDNLKRELKRLKDLYSEKIAIEDRLFIEARKAA